MSDTHETVPARIASDDLAGLSDSDLAVFGTAFDRAASTLKREGKTNAGRVLTALSDALEAELDRRQQGAAGTVDAETTIGDAGADLSRLEASRLLSLLDGLTGRGSVTDDGFLLGLAAAVERQLAHNLEAEARVMGMLEI